MTNLNENQGIIAIIGIILASLLSVLGLRKRKRDNYQKTQHLTSPHIQAGGSIKAGGNIFVGNFASETKVKNNVKFTKREEELINLAKKSNYELYYMTADQISGGWVRVGSHDFHDENDPNLSKRYISALRSLVDKGVIKHIGGILYEVDINTAEPEEKDE